MAAGRPPGHTAGIAIRSGERHEAMSRLLLSLAAVAACATATAAPFDSADQARRERNREEVMAKHGLDNSAPIAPTTTYRVEEKKTSSRRRTSAVAATKNFGHRTADKMREFGAKTDAKFDHKGSPPKSPYQHGPQ
jgi:Ni/Co efflux regulator RcnB